MRRAAVALAVVAAAVLGPVPARAAPYIGSCNSGTLAPRLCTFFASMAVATFAGAGEYALLVPADPLPPGYSDYCYDYSQPRRERYVGKIRGSVGGSPAIGTVSLELRACPDEHVDVEATVVYNGPGLRFDGDCPRRSIRAGFTGVLKDPSRNRTEVRPHGHLLDDLVTCRTGRSSSAEGEMVIRDTGYAVSDTGHYSGCAYFTTQGSCRDDYESGEFSYSAESSVSGHWARLRLTTSYDDRERDFVAEVRAEPYRGTGWKITRVA